MVFQIIDSNDLNGSSQIQSQWNGLISSTENLFMMYQSPEWVRHLCTVDQSSNIKLAVQRDDQDKIVGVVPIKPAPIELKISADRFSITLCSIPSIEIMGSQPLISKNVKGYKQLFDHLWGAFPQCDAFYFKSITSNSACWQLFENSNWRVGKAVAYKIYGDREFYSLKLPDSFDTYISKFKRKKRYNLKRQVRILRDANNGDLKLTLISKEDQVDDFIKTISKIFHKSWKHKKWGMSVPDDIQKPEVLKDLAKRNLLRSYLLQGSDQTSAFVLGYQFQRVYHYADIGFDDSLSKYSPGNVLLFLLIEDIINNTEVSHINFGIGDSQYKRLFANQKIYDTSVLLMKPSAGNYFKRSVHATLNQVKNNVKKFIKRT